MVIASASRATIASSADRPSSVRPARAASICGSVRPRPRAAGTCASRSNSEFSAPATVRMASSRSRPVSAVPNRILAPTCCIALPTSGESSMIANGPSSCPSASVIGTVPAWLALGPPVMAS